MAWEDKKSGEHSDSYGDNIQPIMNGMFSRIRSFFTSLIREAHLEESHLLNSLPEESQDQIWGLAIDLALLEDDTRSLPAASYAALRRRFIAREGIDAHPHARIIHWIEENLLREDRAVLYKLKRLS